MNTEALEERNAKLPAQTAIDFSEVYSLVQAAKEPLHELPASHTSLPPRALGNPIRELILKAFGAAPVALQLHGGSRMVSVPQLSRIGRSPTTLILRQPEPDIFRIEIDARDGTASPLAFDIPAGLPRLINAATLKRILGGKPSDIIFRKAGTHWEICDESYQIDLQDRTKVFRLGKIEISS